MERTVQLSLLIFAVISGTWCPGAAQRIEASVRTLPEFYDALSNKDAFVSVLQHLQFPSGTIIPEGHDQTAVIAGNCARPPQRALPTPRRDRQCVLEVAQNAIRVSAWSVLHFEHIYFLVTAPANSTRPGVAGNDIPAVVATSGFSATTFINVHIQGDPSIPGRGIYVDGSLLQCYRCSFDSLTAPFHSAVAVRHSHATFVDSTFTGNSAVKSAVGAAAAGPAVGLRSVPTSRYRAAAWFHNCTFSNNDSPNGSPVSVTDRNSRVFASGGSMLDVHDEHDAENNQPWMLRQQPGCSGDDGAEESNGACENASTEADLGTLDQMGFSGHEFVPAIVTIDLRRPELDVPELPFDVLGVRDTIWKATSPFPPGPAARGISRPEAFLLAVHDMAQHMVVVRHLDFRPLASQGAKFWFPTLTRSIRGNCSSSFVPPLLPTRTTDAQCVLTTTTGVFAFGAGLKVTLWLSDLYLLVKIAPTRRPGFDATPQSTPGVNADAPAPVPAGQPPLPVVEELEAGPYLDDYYTDEDTFDREYAEWLEGSGARAWGLDVWNADLWMTECVVDLDSKLNVFGGQMVQSQLYARDVFFINGLNRNTEKADWLAPFIQMETSESTFHNCTFADILVERIDPETPAALAISVIGPIDDATLTSVVWLHDTSFHNVTATVGTTLVPSGDETRRRLQDVEADTGELPGGNIVISDLNQEVFSNNPTEIYVKRDDEIRDASSPTAADFRRRKIRTEDSPLFTALVEAQAVATGLSPIERKVMEAPPEWNEPAASHEAPDRVERGHRARQVVIIVATCVAAALVLSATGATTYLWWRRRQRLAAKDDEDEDAYAAGSELTTPGKDKDVYGSLAPASSRSSASKHAVPNLYAYMGPSVYDKSSGELMDSMYIRTRTVAASSATIALAEDAPLTARELSSDPIEALEETLDYMHEGGELFVDEYQVHCSTSRRRGGQGLVQFAHSINDGHEYVIKFFFERWAFQCELELYQNEKLRSMMPAVVRVEQNIDVSLRCSNGLVYPPFIVVERGEALNEWAQRVAPDGITSMFVLCHVAKRLKQLHEAGLSHRDLKPANILWRPRANAWTLIDFGCACQNGLETDLVFSLLYAAPELIEAVEQESGKILATPAVDIWALGQIAFELLTGVRTFQARVTRKEVFERISGRQPLPWEDPANAELLKKLGLLRRSIMSCLERDPADRPSAEEVLNAWNGLLESTTGNQTNMSSDA